MGDALLEVAVSALKGRGVPVQPLGNSAYLATCPTHDDRHPSLALSASSRGVVIRCNAGCTPETLLATLGLDWSDLLTPRKGTTA